MNDNGQRKMVRYRGFQIIPRVQESWPEEDRFGYWISKNHINPVPGAMWFRTVQDARKGVDDLILANGDADLYHLLAGNSGTSTVQQSTGKTATVTLRRFLPDTSVEVSKMGNLYLKFPGLTGIALEPKAALALAALLETGVRHALKEEPNA